MTDTTPRIGAPLLAAAQAQKHVTHNDALIQIDAVTDLYLLGLFSVTPPSSPADGDAYLTAGSPAGAWAGYDYKIAYCVDGGWRFYTPFNGLRAYNAADGKYYVYVSGTWTAWNLAAGHNLIINGEMSVDQRNAGASQTFTAGASPVYCVDRFYASCTGANVTGQQVFGGGSYRKAYQFTGTAANTGTLFGQRIESANIGNDIIAKPVTCQVEISSNALTVLTWTAYYANAGDNWSAKTQIATGTLAIGSAPAIYSFSFNSGANAGNGIAIEFTAGALLAGKTLTYSGVKLEAGALATPFQREDFATTENRCLRYYYRWKPKTSADPICIMQAWQATRVFGKLADLPVPMRAPPTTGISSPGDFELWNAAGSAAYPMTSLVLDAANRFSIAANGPTAATASLVAGNASIFTAANTNAWFAADAEL